MYPQNVLDDIKDRLSIAGLIGERIPLKKAGRNFKGNCPFHSEKTPSFMVSDEKQIYHCFGCGEGGNIFNFFMKFDGLSFRETVEMLASRAGVKLPQLGPSDRQKEDEGAVKKKWALRLNELVAEYFLNNLLDEKRGAQAINYLKTRDIFLEKSKQHFLGYAEDSWDGLVRFLTARKVPLELAAELGVVKKRDGGGYYDFFRHRVMFPVIVPGAGGERGGSKFFGKVVAFSGRTFGNPATAEGREPPAKYLNSPDSLIYHKSYTVFGLHAAADAIRKGDQVILVEGNLDVVRCHQEGLQNVVAPLGTALTSGHLKLLGRYTKNFVVIFDGDEAGRKAAKRSLPLFLEAELVPRIVALKNGEDPDSFVRKEGAAALRALIDKAGTLFEWLIDMEVASAGSGTDGKVRAIEELKPLFAMVRNPVELSIYRKRLASQLLVDEQVLVATLAGRKGRLESAKTPAKSNPIERTLLELMLAHPETAPEIAAAVDVETFSDGSYQTIARIVLDEFAREKKVDVAKIAGQIEDAELKNEVLSLAMADEKYEDPKESVKSCIAAVKKASLKRRLAELSDTIAKASKDDESLGKYMAEVQNITKELHSLNKRESHERTGT
jgi:DNA primase